MSRLENSFRDDPERNREREPLLGEPPTEPPDYRDEDVDNVKAWLLALGISYLSFLIQGMGRIAGLLYISFMEVFHANRAVASAPYSVQQSVRMLFGPVVGILGQHFGNVFVTVLGCLVAAASTAASYFAKDMTQITILWGALYGVGDALALTVNLILIDQYFVRHKSTATGLAFAGASMGAIVLPAALSFSIDKYGVSQTFLLMGSILLLTVPVAMVLKEKPKRKQTLELSHGSSSKFSSIPEAESSFGIGLNPDRPTKTYGTPERASADDTASNVNFFGTKDMKTSTPLTSLEKTSSEKASVKVPGTIPPGYRFSEKGSKIIDEPVKESKSKKSRRKSSKKSKKGEERTVTVTFKESRSSAGSNIESSIELAPKMNLQTEKESSQATMLSKKDSSEGKKEELTGTSFLKRTENNLDNIATKIQTVGERAASSGVIKNVTTQIQTEGEGAASSKIIKNIAKEIQTVGEGTSSSEVVQNIKSEIQTVGERASSSEVIKNIKSNLESELFTVTKQSKSSSFDDGKRVITSVMTEKSEKIIDTLESPKKNVKSSTKQRQVLEEPVVSSKKYEDAKRVEENSESEDYTADEEESSPENERKIPVEDRYSINFNILHENNDLVLDLLVNKIPLNDEEVVPSASEITQSNLESSDTEFLARELRRLEQCFQLPVEKRDQYLSEIQEKLRKFHELLNADRNEFRKQKNLDFEGKQLAYKDIHSTTITKPDCTIEITEYSFEIPVDLYIPVKLQELNERGITYVASYYPEDPRVFDVLPELKKLNDIFSKPPQSARYSSESSSFQYKSYGGFGDRKRPIGEYRNTFRNHIRNACQMHCNPLFLLVCLCRGMYTLAFVPVVTSVIDYSMDKSMSEDYEIYPIIAVSVGDLIGRLCTGWITDKGFISDKYFMVIFMILQGASTASLPLMGPLALLPALAVFAILQGALFMKQPMVLMNYLRTHEKYIGLGFVNFISGILGLTIPFYIGHFRDEKGSYDMIYFINGGISAILGVLWLFEPLLVRFVPKIREGGDYTPSYYH